MPSRKDLAAPAPSKKKPKKITGPPPRSRPFKRPYHVSKDRFMSWYRSDANRLFLNSPFSEAFPLLLLDKLPKLQQRSPLRDDEPMAVNGFDATKKHFFAAQARRERAVNSPFSEAFPLLLLDKLPKPQQISPLRDDEPTAVNGFDATKKHFFAAQAKWERAVEIMEEEGRRMVYYGETMLEEAQACHKWVGQVGKMTWDGHHGRMKNYDAFEEALDKVRKMGRKVVKTVNEVQEPTKKWPVEFICQRRAWEKEEEDPTDGDEEDGDLLFLPFFPLI